MDIITNFDKLIINLSSNEKKELLEKMEMTFEISQEPLVVQEEVVESDFANFQQEYESLTIVHKIYLFIQSLLKQKDIPSLLKDHKVNVLRKKYFSNCDYGDFKNSLLTQAFYNELVKLKEPCRFFRKSLQNIFNFDDKQDFYAFIGGVILPDLQSDLLRNTDPWKLEKDDHEKEDNSIKGDIDNFFEMKMDSVSDLDCTIMNEACQSLYGLFLLCSFDLNGVCSSFDSVTAESGKSCSITEVAVPLLELAGILKSLIKPPSIRAMEALFLYSNGDDDLKDALNKKMILADTYLSVIRDFNKNIPLENFVKVLSGDLSKRSQKPPVVEDWFRIYKKFWSSRISRKYAFFVNERKKSESERDVCVLTGLKLIRPFDKYTRGYFWSGSPARYEKSIAFIQAFQEEILAKIINPTLMVIRSEGEFYKKDNKSEFEKVINYLTLLEGKLFSIRNMMNGHGFLAGKLSRADREDEEKRRRTISSSLEQVDFEISSLLEGFIENLKLLNKVMHGIVIGDGGAYDTLSNISSIGGRSNPEVRETFKYTSLILNKIVKYISEMKFLEEKR